MLFISNLNIYSYLKLAHWSVLNTIQEFRHEEIVQTLAVIGPRPCYNLYLKFEFLLIKELGNLDY